MVRGDPCKVNAKGALWIAGLHKLHDRWHILRKAVRERQMRERGAIRPQSSRRQKTVRRSVRSGACRQWFSSRSWRKTLQRAVVGAGATETDIAPYTIYSPGVP